jgi:cytochrome b pre-mRNA-processing protein 3
LHRTVSISICAKGTARQAAQAQEPGLGLLNRIFGRDDAPDMAPLYAAVIARARRPEWYERGGVPDTIDGRFEVLALVMAVVLLRIERDGREGALPSARLAEVFVHDMDGQMRETGFGDLVVGKQVTKVMGALGGRLGAYRLGYGRDAIMRNLWRGEDYGDAALADVQAQIAQLAAQLDARPLAEIVAGHIA